MNDINSYGFELPDKDLPSFEIISYLEKRMKEKVEEYQSIVKEKDETIKRLRQRIVELESFIEEIKNEYSKSNEELVAQNRELILKFEESKNILVKQKEKHEKEIALLKSVFEKTKSDIDSLSDELALLKKERTELKQINIKLETEKRDLETKLSMIDSQLAQSKKAVEQTLSELFSERKKTEELSKKIRELESSNQELLKQIEGIKSAWDSERQQWKEMWERERSLWESHRMEFAVWEERLRNEREAWLKLLKEEESKGVENAKKLAEVLEESSKWSYKVGELLKLYASKEIVLPHIFTSVDTVKKKIKSGVRKTLAFALLSFMFLSVAGYVYYDYSRKIHLSFISETVLDDNSYTSFIKFKDRYIFAHPRKGIVIKDNSFNNIDVIDSIENTTIKPLTVSLEGDYVWVFDISSVKFIKIDIENRKIISSVKSLTYAPQGLYSDGNYLWSFDGVGGVLHRYELNGEIKNVKTYELDGIKTADSITWMDDNLIVLSNSKLYRFKFENERFIIKSVQKAKNFVYCYLYNDEIYILKDMISSKNIDIYKIKNRESI